MADYDSDGREDLLRQDGTNWRIYRSNGATLPSSYTDSLATLASNTPFAVDVSGDGLPDIVQNYGGYWQTHPHLKALPDVVTAVTDGLGNRVEVDYEPLSNSTHHTQHSTSAPTAPYVRKFRGARYVVTQERRDNGIGGERVLDHHYDSAWIETGGRGSFSFYRHINYDKGDGTQTKTHTQTYYHQVFPYFGMPTYSGLMRSSDGQVIRAVLPTTSQSVWTATTPARRFVRVEYSMALEYSLSGTYLRRIEENPEYETSYGRLLSTATETYEIGNGAQWTSYTTFEPPDPEASWCLNRPGLVTTTNTLFDRVTTAQRKVNHTWNGCTLAWITDESESSAAKQLRTTFTYDGYGNPDVVTRNSADSSGQARSVDYEYDDWGQFPESVTIDTLNLATSFTWDYTTGQRASVTPSDSLSTNWQFDPFGRLLAQNGPGVDTTVTYGACSSCWPANAVFFARTQGTDNSDEYEFFDELGRSVGRSWKIPGGNEGRQATRYDAEGQIDEVDVPYVYGQPYTYATKFDFDLIGRLVKEDPPEVSGTDGYVTYAYNGLETQVAQHGVTTKTTKYLHNGLRQIKKVTDALNGETDYGYAPFGELAMVIDAEEHTTTISYNARGLKIELDDPNMGTWAYDYNVHGELTRQRSPVTTSTVCDSPTVWTVCLAFDQAGRPTSRVEAEGTTSWSYYTAGDGAMGRVDTISGPGHALKYTYDSSHGEPLQVRHTLDGTHYYYDFTYDSLSRLDELTYPETSGGYRLKVNYDYDDHGHLTVAKDGDSPYAPFYTLTEADALGRELTIELGSGANQLYEQWGYNDATGALEFIRTGKNSGTEIQNLAFTFDEAGNLTARTNTNIGRTETLSYDALNRLDTAQVSGGGPLIDPTYSAAGRILSKSDVGSYSYSGGCGGGPYAVKSAGGQSFCYDAAGRMTSRAGLTQSWTSFDLPSVLRAGGNQSAEFSYGVDRGRYKQVRKTGSTVDATILYIGSLLEQETAGGTTTWRHFVSARGRTVAQVLRTGSTNTVQYLHRDHQGSVVEVTNSSGTLVQSLAFDAWGLRRNPANWLALASPFGGTQPTERGYTGHEHLDNVELVHMNGRVQDPKLGRFLSADPTVPVPFHTQSFDRYSYVFNNPASLVDPSGFTPWDGDDRVWSPPLWDWPMWSPPMVICCFVADPDTGGPMGPKGDASWNPGGFSLQPSFMPGEHEIASARGERSTARRERIAAAKRPAPLDLRRFGTARQAAEAAIEAIRNHPDFTKDAHEVYSRVDRRSEGDYSYAEPRSFGCSRASENCTRRIFAGTDYTIHSHPPDADQMPSAGKDAVYDHNQIYELNKRIGGGETPRPPTIGVVVPQSGPPMIYDQVRVDRLDVDRKGRVRKVSPAVINSVEVF